MTAKTWPTASEKVAHARHLNDQPLYDGTGRVIPCGCRACVKVRRWIKKPL